MQILRLRGLLAYGFFFAAILAAESSSLAVPATERRPNILLITSEDMGPNLSCYGDPYVKTPNLDRLAKEGVMFKKAFVTQAGCSPSRSSILTGQYPHQNGQIGLATWGFRMYREDTPNIVGSLKQAGYRTGIIGKLHVSPESAFPFETREIPAGNFARKKLGNYAKFAGEFFSAGKEPFFLMVNYPDAHDPWLRQVDGLPEDPADPAQIKSLAYFGIDTPELREDCANYYSCIERLDSMIGDLLEKLKESGQAENTLIVYLGDHGAAMLRGKRTCYEGGLRVPMILRWPASFKGDEASDQLVSSVDLVPTMLAAAGAPAIKGLPGYSLLPLLRGEKDNWREYLFTEFHAHAAKSNFYPQRAVRDQRFKLIENLLPGETNPGYAYTNHAFPSTAAALEQAPQEVRAAYLLMETPPRFELYDLQSDPYEFRNLANDPAHAETLEQLQRQLTQWREQTADPLLKARNLQLLKNEVLSVSSKKAGKDREWGYPFYFFGLEPPTQGAQPEKKRKKQQTSDEEGE